MNLVESVYRFTCELPRDETFGLCSQMRRAAISVPSNIAEGAARSTSKELHQYLMVANGSLSELDTQIEICRRLGYGDTAALQAASEQVHKLLSALVASIRRKL